MKNIVIHIFVAAMMTFMLEQLFFGFGNNQPSQPATPNPDIKEKIDLRYEVLSIECLEDGRVGFEFMLSAGGGFPPYEYLPYEHFTESNTSGLRSQIDIMVIDTEGNASAKRVILPAISCNNRVLNWK